MQNRKRLTFELFTELVGCQAIIDRVKLIRDKFAVGSNALYNSGQKPVLVKDLLGSDEINLWSADVGVGKTFFGLFTALNIMKGTPVFGHLEVTERNLPYKVAYLALDAPRNVYERQWTKITRSEEERDTEGQAEYMGAVYRRDGNEAQPGDDMILANRYPQSLVEKLDDQFYLIGSRSGLKLDDPDDVVVLIRLLQEHTRYYMESEDVFGEADETGQPEYQGSVEMPKEQKGFDVLFIDTYRTSLAGNENDSGETQQYWDNLTFIQEQLHCAIVVLGHLNKRGYGENRRERVSAERFRGSSAANAAISKHLQFHLHPKVRGVVESFVIKGREFKNVAAFMYMQKFTETTAEFEYLREITGDEAEGNNVGTQLTKEDLEDIEEFLGGKIVEHLKERKPAVEIIHSLGAEGTPITVEEMDAALRATEGWTTLKPNTIRLARARAIKGLIFNDQFKEVTQEAPGQKKSWQRDTGWKPGGWRGDEGMEAALGQAALPGCPLAQPE